MPDYRSRARDVMGRPQKALTIALLFTLACSDRNVPTALPAVATLKDSIEVDARESDRISISGSNGTFTLDVSAQEIVASNGVVMKMSATETAEMTSLFTDIIVGTSTADWLESNPSEDPYADCGWGGLCQESVYEPLPQLEVLPSVQDTSTQQSPVIRMRLRSSADSNSTAPRSTESLLLESSLTAMSGPGECWSLWLGILEMTPVFRAAKAELYQKLTEVAQTVELHFPDGRPTLKMDFWQATFFEIMLLKAQVRFLRLQLDVMRVKYELADCNNYPFWPDSDWAGSFEEGVQVYVCWPEDDWEISYDGGLTWEPLDLVVTVCEYRVKQT